MGFLGKMGAAVGIGAARVAVTLPKGEYAWGDAVQGSITLTGGNVDQTVSDVRISVMEHWETHDSEDGTEHHYRHHAETVIAREIALAAGASQTMEFEISVPHGLDFSSNWYIAARLGIPKAKDSEGYTLFQLRPPLAMRGLAAALTQVAPFQLKATGNSGPVIHMDFTPPPAQQNSLDGVKFMVSQNGDVVSGELEINPQEKSFADRLKALARKDRVRHPISFPAAGLETALNGPAPDEVVTRLRGLIGPYLQ